MIQIQLKNKFFHRIRSICFLGRKLNRENQIFAFELFTILLLVSSTAFAQTQNRPANIEERGKIIPLRVGQKVPQEFWTREYLFFVNGDTIRRTFDEYKGKLLVLDFWFTGCTKCLLHQKEINHFKAIYSEELAVVMVNSSKSKENYQTIVNYVESDRFQRLGLDSLVSIIEDEYLEQLFAYTSYPSYFWINSLGILQTHTFRNLLDRNYSVPFLP